MRIQVARLLLAAALLFAVVCHAAPASAEHTPLTHRQLVAALRAGHIAVFGVAPSRDRLLVALAQTSLETGRGKYVYCYNVGNLGAAKRGCRTRGGFRVLRFSSARRSSAAYWRLSSVRSALPYFDRGDARGAAFALGRAGYFTADPEPYAVGMASLYREFKKGKSP